MEGNPFWVSVQHVLNNGTTVDRKRIHEYIQISDPTADTYEIADPYIVKLEKLSRLYNQKSFHIDTLDENLTMDEVVEIFVAINSGSKRLSGSDLALAKLSARVPGARKHLNDILEHWKSEGYRFTSDWLLKCVTTCTTGSAYLSALDKVTSSEFKSGLSKTKNLLEKLIYTLQTQLGLDSHKVIGVRMAFPLMVRYLALANAKRNGNFNKPLLLYWYIQSLVNRSD